MSTSENRPPTNNTPAVDLPPATGIAESWAAFRSRVRGGDLGAIPVVVGLALIWTIFQILNPTFLSSANLVNLAMQSAALGTIALGVVLVLLLAQIDLSVGSLSGLAAAILAVTFTQLGWPLIAAIAAALAAGAIFGWFYGFLLTRFGVPSFVITLAGLLGVLGLQLWVLGKLGSINIPFDSWIVQFAQLMFLPAWLSYVLAGVATLAYVGAHLSLANRRSRAGLLPESRTAILLRGALMIVALLFGAWYLNTDRGIGLMFLLFIVLVIAMDFALKRTRWGRSIYAVGGNVEAARRAGIRVDRVYISVFMVSATLAALGGILAASRLAAANQSSGGGDTNLTAIAAAVIGGASLFGGRGSAWSALLGIVVIQSISSGLTLLSLDSSVRYMVTGAVLLLAVIIDSMSRRSRALHGRF
ncbi:simple sugar transport system permease protein/D-xylose transport system permease protein [Salinibacterium amurskyense]|uniref:Xylose transport system permease protein XylH n=1 Tax=Salinibacterium amurskyense TaxID=205941 RepID=A0A2M9D298_9MICO|nr:ABC transporter permease [Salinibacterium amurskyense]PJJ78314.1 simple sugar transport system permease protein/D-xylose transport system permease protein [Salinibacterium amurskyense]RLQ80425.1 sugar ABC transporter permease [Salinibacterium amurskyense]GHD83469.1 ABC transporter permease [Salinibacterium amurskyense]